MVGGELFSTAFQRVAVSSSPFKLEACACALAAAAAPLHCFVGAPHGSKYSYLMSFLLLASACSAPALETHVTVAFLAIRCKMEAVRTSSGHEGKDKGE